MRYAFIKAYIHRSCLYGRYITDTFSIYLREEVSKGAYTHPGKCRLNPPIFAGIG